MNKVSDLKVGDKVLVEIGKIPEKYKVIAIEGDNAVVKQRFSSITWFIGNGYEHRPFMKMN